MTRRQAMRIVRAVLLGGAVLQEALLRAQEGDAARPAPEAGTSAEAPEDPAPEPMPPSRLAILDPVVVTATRIEEGVFDVPYSAESLDGNTLINERAVRTLPDALRGVPGVMLQRTAHGQGSPFLRGFTGFRTLLLIDGIRLNNAVFREGPNQYWSTVDPLTIERLEVVKGPSSVLYGSDAVGGTVNVITRSRDPAAAGKGPALGDFDWERRAYYRYASAEDSNIVRGELGGAFAGRVGAVGGVSYKDFNDLSGGRDTGLLEETGYEEFDGDAKTTVRLAKDVDLVLAYQQANLDDVPRTHSTVFSKSFHLTEVGTDLQRDLDQRRQLVYSQLQWRDAAPWLSRATASLSYHLQEETEDRIQGNGRRRKQGFDDGQLGAWLQMESPSPVGTLTYGAEIYHDEVDSFARDLNADGSVRLTTPRGPVADNASYDLFGVYLQDRIVIADRVEVIPGGRFNYALARADQVDPDPAAGPVFDSLDEDYHAAAGSLRLLYRATETWNLFGGASQGFRAPNLSDLTRFDVARSGELETPAPDLDPEKFLSLEVGTKVRLEEAKVEGYLSYHYTFIDDLIDRFPTGEVVDGLPVVTKENVGDGFIHGVELSLAWNFYQGFTAFGSFAWLEGEADTVEDGERQREPLSRIQPATALLGLRWDSPARRFWVEGTIEMVDNQDRLSPGDEADTQRIPPGGTPGYTVYGLRAGMEVIEDLNVFAGVENLTDKNYRVHGSGVNEVGTNVFVGADWRF